MKLLTRLLLGVLLVASSVAYAQVEPAALPTTTAVTSQDAILDQQPNGKVVQVTPLQLAQFFQPQTAAEILASVTPANYLYPVGNVLRYGADPTGRSDSSIAFSQDCLVDGATAFIPAGTYKISAIWSCGNGVVFAGAGEGVTTIEPTGAVGAFAFTGGTGGGVRDLTINGSALTGSGNIAISAVGINRFTIERVQTLSVQNGIYIQTCNACAVWNSYLNGIANGSYAIELYGANTSFPDTNGVDIKNVPVGTSQTATSSSPECLVIDGSVATVDIDHFQCVKTLHTLHVQNTSGTPIFPEFVYAHDTQGQNTYSDVYLLGGGFREGYFTSCYAQGSQTGAGFNILATTYRISISKCDISSNSNQGILDNGRNVKVSLSDIFHNNQGGGGYSGVEASSTAVGLSLSGNLIGQSTGESTGQQLYGFLADAGATYYSALGNNMLGNATAPYADNAGDPNSIICNNAGAQCEWVQQLAPTTVSGLGSCGSSKAGMIRYVTDASSPSYNATLTGGSSTTTLALCNGANWVAH